MENSTVTETTWNADKNLIITNISGNVNESDIEKWETSLKDALAKIEDNTTFKIFVNLHGFKAIDIAAHKRFREIVPITLASYGWKVGYLDLFEEEARSLRYTNTRGIQCVGAAHAHQDETKIELYQSRYSRNNEHFFTDPDKALQWIESLSVNG